MRVACWVSKHPAWPRPTFPPPLPIILPSPNRHNLLCTVLFLDTFRCTPRKRRMSSLLQGKKFQTCGSARCFFQVLGGWFFPLSGWAWTPQCAPSLPPLQQFATWGSRFLTTSSAKMGSAAFFPQAAWRNIFVYTKAYCSPSVFSLSIPP